MQTPRLRMVSIGAVILVVAAAGAIAALPASESFLGGDKVAAAAPAKAEPIPAELIVDGAGEFGLRSLREKHHAQPGNQFTTR